MENGHLLPSPVPERAAANWIDLPKT